MNIVFSNWGWPQYVYASLSLLTLLGYMACHGKPREKYNGYVGLCNFLVAFILLTAGGFFA